MLAADRGAEVARSSVHGDVALATYRCVQEALTNVARHAEQAGMAPALRALTPRELDVLALVGPGRDNADIAGRLAMSPATVKTHVGRALSKTNAYSRAQLVVVAYETGLIRPGDDR